MVSNSADLIDEVSNFGLAELTTHDSVFQSWELARQYNGDLDYAANMAIGALVSLIHAAVRATESGQRALSWRDYRVGAVAMMVNFPEARLGFLTGYNIKPQSGKSQLNIHAEQMALAKGRQAGLDRLVGLAVIADPNDADANPAGLPTLPPCSRCVDMLKHAPEANERVLILGATPTADVCQLYTQANLTESASSPLLDGVFSLASEADLARYDQRMPYLVAKVKALFD